jgi:replicative DNA helicase
MTLPENIERNRQEILRLREEVGGVLADYQDKQSLSVTAEEAYQIICEEKAAGKKKIETVPLWDDLFGPLRPGNLYVICGYPGVGKTSFALNMLWAIAQHDKAWMCCLEMEPGEVLTMMAPIAAPEVPMGDEDALLATAYAKIQPTGMRFSRIPGSRDWKVMFKTIMRTTEMEKFKVLFIDNFMYLTRAPKDVLTVEGIVSMGLKQEAQRLGIPIVLLHHLRKPTEDGREPEPGAHAMRGSGALHADASVVAILHHPLTKGEGDMYATRDPVGYLAAGKNRWGGGGKRYVHLDGARHLYTSSISSQYQHVGRGTKRPPAVGWGNNDQPF